MKKLDERQLQELVEMAKNFEREIREQCMIAGKIYDKYERVIETSQEKPKQRID
jgi:tRNA1(Val) A37 N6-methylase TrmN6